MNRQLRSRHRRTLQLLALLLPIGVAGGLAVRPSYPAMRWNELPSLSYRLGRGQPLEAHWIREGEGDDVEIDVTIVPPATAPDFDTPDVDDTPQLLLTPRRDPHRPGVLVYWRSTEAAPPLPGLDALRQSTWVGSLSGTAARMVELPPQARDQAGQLLLFSLGHQVIFASATIPAVSRE